MAEEQNEEKIMGVWTKEELMDDVFLGLLAALAAFLSVVFTTFLSKWLKQHKWFKES